MQIIDISAVETLPQPSRQRHSHTNARWWFALLSVLIHIAILASLSWSISVPPDNQIHTVKAVLMPLPASSVAPQKPLQKAQPAALPTTRSADAAESAQTQLQTNLPSSVLNESAQIAPTSTATNSSPIGPKPTKETPPDIPAMSLQSEHNPAPASHSIRQSISQALQQQQTKMQHDLAAAAAQVYRQQQSSPDLRTGESPSPLPPQPGEYQINCNKGVNSSLALVARLFGGKVKCSQRNAFKQYIDKRVNKTHLDKD